MKKYVVIINGKGGVGKDTLCDIVSKRYCVKNVSSITPIKQIAQIGGWKGGKENKDRKFLADLKKLFVEYNDLPFEYLKEEMNLFLQKEQEILFVHIREIEEIKKFLEYVVSKDVMCKTLLVTRKQEQHKVYGNEADDMAEQYQYDVVYQNDMPLKEVEKDFMIFFEKNVLQ
ncbi:hypothetical protein [Clostridium sp. MD294]|uniref:hypothetical protein n=1 Tax=Clostridium sp. MD294 TaxID=97138 RepID=UPI0002CCC326|nr:hypothetical protein [Clostridium sp. MD294]NDO46252.1 hypothetical protein [Clostridium sp. MD294]USF29322.1 hypothetical protein C820_000707 [Clostridium sp. MD294]